MELSSVGLWTATFDNVPWKRARQAVRAAEDQGWATLWLPESFGREIISLSSAVLASTARMVVATGVANLWARDALALVGAQELLGEAYPGRFLLGVGVSHKLVARRRGGDFADQAPLTRLRDYLDAMKTAPYQAVKIEGERPLVIAALGPKMLELARERTDGAHTYNSPSEHTAWARTILGDDRLLVPEVKVVLGRSTADSRRLARSFLPLKLPAYAANLIRTGFTPAELEDGGSDRLVDALVAYGDVDAVRARVDAHLSAGADQVALNVLVEPGQLPDAEWAELAALAELTVRPVRPVIPGPVGTRP